MMVAAVAYTKLDQATKNRVDALLMKNPDRPNWLRMIPRNTSAAKKKMFIFMIAATWPDRIKGNGAYHNDGPAGGNLPPTDGTANNNIGYTDFARHKYWHFVDIFFSNDGTTVPAVITPNAQTRITDFRAVLASNSPDELKSYDLSWLLHLVGDIHQPLHCAARVTSGNPDGDAGGNFVKLKGKPNNLHSIWDGGVGSATALQTIANMAAALAKAPAASASDLDVQRWVDESFALAKKEAYRKPPIGDGTGPFTPTTAYRNKIRDTSKRRVALAGARLATILNDELK
jgi:hypothetical protein